MRLDQLSGCAQSATRCSNVATSLPSTKPADGTLMFPWLSKLSMSAREQLQVVRAMRGKFAHVP